MSIHVARALTIIALTAALGGCGVLLAGTAGGVAATELEENDGVFDPLERTSAGPALQDAGETVGDAVQSVGDAVN